jgi:uncharacterized damage-inducible protein DinB
MTNQRTADSMTDMTTALRHLRWADERLFAQLAKLPDAALDATYGPADWTVSHLAQHIVGGAEWYRYCLTGVRWSDLVLPRTHADLDELRLHLGAIDDVLIAEASMPDEEVRFDDEDGPRSALRSMLLAQACYHSTEHRTQIACALELNGIPGITLDDFDLWAFTDASRDAPP